MSLSVKGKLSRKLSVESGTSKAGKEWKKQSFLVDTGATDVAIPESIANQAGLPKGEARQAATANGIVNVYSTKVASLTLGNISLYDIDASITPSMFNDTILLGMSALSEIDFSQVGASLTLKQTPN